MKKPAATVTVEVPSIVLEKMQEFYQENLVTPPNEYVAFLAKLERVSVTGYKKETKGLVKVVFQGVDAVYESSIWGKGKVARPKKPTVVKPALKKEEPFAPQIGSDEVGTGDFFGPVVVCAAYVDEEGLSMLNLLGVTDSKKMNDDYIMQIGPNLISNFDYVVHSVSNEKYNEVTQKGMNMNSIKAKLHNSALFKLSSRHPGCKICQDQFAEPDLYYSYLRGDQNVVYGIEFSTKGELAYPSVALASCIARYVFLTKMKELSEQYETEIPLGAGAKVDEFAATFKEKYGLNELRKIVKANFANFNKIK